MGKSHRTSLSSGGLVSALSGLQGLILCFPSQLGVQGLHIKLRMTSGSIYTMEIGESYRSELFLFGEPAVTHFVWVR